MTFGKLTFFFFTSISLIVPSIVSAAGVSNKNVSICDVVMAHDSITAEFPALPTLTIKAGDSLNSKIIIKNKTVYTYKNTSILYKVFYNSETEEDRRIVDVGVFKEKYDVVGGTENAVDVSWKSNDMLTTGSYYMVIYVIQNGVHVIGDFARDNSTRSYISFNIEGKQSESPLIVESEKTLIGGSHYVVDKMLMFSKEETDRSANIFIKNKSKERQNVTLNWKVYNYGLFEEKDIFLSTSTVFIIEPNQEYQTTLEIPLVPSNRYHAILDVENNGLHTFEMFRWGRLLPAPSSLDNYGVVHDGEFFSNTEVSKDFGLMEGERYIAFACLVGGYERNRVTVSMRLRDEKGNIIFSKEETKVAGTETTKFEYPFIPIKFSSKMKLDITVINNDIEQKASWESDCGDNKEGVCKNDFSFGNLKLGYLISVLVIASMFLIPHTIKNKKIK